MDDEEVNLLAIQHIQSMQQAEEDYLAFINSLAQPPLNATINFQ